MKNQARPIYEREVSHFESGSGKISKIYHSIKESDVYDGKEAGKLQQKLTWGNTKGIGRNISAWATSYGCSHCFKNIYAFLDNTHAGRSQASKCRVIERDNSSGRRLKIEVAPREIVEGYLPKALDKKVEELKVEDVVIAVKKFTRPPLEALQNDDYFKKIMKKAGLDLLNEKVAAEFSKKAGNQAIFICPFCQSVSDADIQAALWIALKGYLDILSGKDKNQPKKLNQKIKEKWLNAPSLTSKMAFLMKFAKDNQIQPVKLDLAKRR